MTTSQPLENTVLALSPPRAPEATTPVIGAHFGVPKHVYDLKPMGLKIDIDPPLGGTVSPGDVITLVLNGQPVKNKSIEAGQENDVSTLYIDKGLLMTNRVNQLVYTITRGSQNIGTSTPVMTLLYNNVRPGMQDRTPGDGAHSELQLLLPQDVIEDGIDAERAKQGVQVCFSYPYSRAHDLIRLNCNGHDVYRTVGSNEAPAIGTAEPTTVCVIVGEAVFEAAGDSPTFVFSYTVNDQLGNGPDTDSPWSGAVTVDVHSKQTRLVAPDLAENPEDQTDDPHTIDLAKLGGKDLTVLVHAFAAQWQPNDKIRVSYTATPPTGAVVSHTVEADVARIPFTYRLMVPNAKVIAGSTARAKYELVRNGVVIATSNTTTAEVTGAGSIELLPPTLVKPAVSPIDVLAYPNGATMRIEYLGALDGDRARLVEINAPAGSPQFPLVAFNSNKRVNVVLSAAYLAARHGKVIEFRWNLNRNSGQAGKSPVVKLNVLKIKDSDPRLPMPKISQAPDNLVLDLNDFTGDADVWLPKWPAATIGQRIWLRCVSVREDGTEHNIELLSSYEITEEEAENGLKGVKVPRTELTLLKNGSDFYVEARIAFIGTAEFTTSTLFQILKLKLKNINFVSGFESWQSEPPQKFNQGTPVKFRSGLTISIIKDSPDSVNSVQIYYQPSFFPPAFGTATLLADRHSIFELNFNGSARKAELQFSAVHAHGTTIKFCNNAGETLELARIPLTAPHLIYKASYIAKAGEHIAFLRIEVGPEADGGIWVDNILWE